MSPAKVRLTLSDAALVIGVNALTGAFGIAAGCGWYSFKQSFPFDQQAIGAWLMIGAWFGIPLGMATSLVALLVAMIVPSYRHTIAALVAMVTFSLGVASVESLLEFPAAC